MTNPMRIALVYLNNDKISVSRGPGYIASVVLAAGYDLTFFDTAYRTVEDVATEVVADGYDVLLVSASTLFYAQAKRLVAEVKAKRGASVIVVLGGLHATIVKGEILEGCSGVDFICVGEGEGFIVEFLWALKNGGDVFAIDNLGRRAADGTAVINPVRPCTDLDTLPPFRFDIFDRRTLVNDTPRPGFCYVYATRGCPYNCTFCCNSFYLDFYGRDYLRARSVDATIAELRVLQKTYPVKLFYFGDEMILFDAAYVTELFRRIKSELGVAFGCMVRAERITPSIVELFRETGCRYVGMGIECGDEKFRREWLNRRMTNERIIEAFAALRTIPGMFLASYNMRGYPVPYDDELTKQTRALNDVIKPDIMQMSVFYPFRGTKLYDYCVTHDLIDPVKLKQVDDGIQDYFSMSVLRKQYGPDLEQQK